MSKIYIKITICLLITFIIIQRPVLGIADEIRNDTTPAILSQGAVVFDSTRGQMLFKKSPTGKITLPLAADIMTVLLAVEKVKLDTKVTISEQVKTTEGEVLFDRGGKYGFDELLLSLLLSPTTFVSNTITLYITDDPNKFVTAMNQKAKTLGMTDTTFTAVSSLDSANLQTTIDDFSKLVKEAINNPIMDSILATPAKPWISKEGTHVLINPNKLFWMGLEGINGGTYQNLKNIGNSITTATRDSQKLVCIVTGGKKDDAFTDTATLMNYCFSKYNKSMLVAKDTILHQIDFNGKTLPLASMEDVYYTHPVGNSYIKNLDFKIKNGLKTPINENTVIGTAKYTLTDDTVIEVNLYSKTSVAATKNLLNELKIRLSDNKDILYIILILCVLELGLLAVNIYKRLQKAHN